MTTIVLRDWDIEYFGILIDLNGEVPQLHLVTPRGHFSGDGWQIDGTGGDFTVREVRDLGMRVNGRRVPKWDLIAGDRLLVDGKHYLWKEIERPRKG